MFVLSNVNQNLLDCLNALQKTHDYISELESEVDKLKSDNSIKSLLPYVKFHLYRPVKVYTKNEKCSKCDDNGFVRTKDYFYTRYELCDCQKLFAKYNVDVLDVFSTSYFDDCITYDCCNQNEDLISVSKSFVYDSFSEDHLKYNYKSVYYTDKKDCEEFCRRLNNE